VDATCLTTSLYSRLITSFLARRNSAECGAVVRCPGIFVTDKRSSIKLLLDVAVLWRDAS